MRIRVATAAQPAMRSLAAMAVEQALVLGGGGVAGIAWMTGLLADLAECGQDVTGGTDLVIGTSAGVNVAAQLGSGLSLAALSARQADPACRPELMAEIDWAKFAAEFEPHLAGAGTLPSSCAGSGSSP